ncbi:MAG: phosphate acyltransferase PlsX [Bacteroidetes bacterium]|nr:phosphate acyltransferase PlsX [Bacteroidota bacterium]MBU1423120.1 phosphate acyltransferase PlsX [Bacteroidota bacterium]MBU2636629.1 phosphate acyltransferase PlsX [Bacteroidota bacterium]
MGGDFAPQNIVAGALDALRHASNRFDIILVGREDEIKKELEKHSINGLRFSIVNATEVVGMDESPTVALKQKKDSSITVGLTLHKEGKADAFISAGNTGAVMSASTIILGRAEGVSRPTIGTPFPTEKGPCLLLDAGANVDCKPQHLLEFGMMGSIYANYILGYDNPTVGLINIGEESTKGNEITLEAYNLLQKSKLNFIGNIEGRDILKGKANVIVCDGFVGNIVLKFAESVLGLLKAKFKDYTASNLLNKIWVGLMYRTLKKILKDFDYQEHGGVPLLGVNGISIIGHGGSTPKAIMNMILKAEDMLIKEVDRHIAEIMLVNKNERQ